MSAVLEIPTQSLITRQDREQEDMRRLFVGLVCVLLGVGIQMVHSASLTSMPGQSANVFLNKHLVFLGISVICGFAASFLPPSFLQKRATGFYIILVLLLIAVLTPGIGTRVNGAQRWLRFGGLSLQPSELGRLVLPLIAVKVMVHVRDTHGFSVRTIPRTLLPLVVVLPLVAKEPDLGATVFLAIGYMTALFLGGWPLRYFVGMAALTIPAGVSLFALKSYQMKRITGFMAAWQDLSQAPWQIRQSLLSLGSGGLQGTGIGGGWQKLSYLPEANTDFVFAVIGEELGLAGTLGVIVIWIGVFLTGRAVLRPLRRDSFEWILGSTLVIQIVLQALANVAVVTAMVPPKGVPHPFISYGGTNLLVNVVAVGLIVGLSRAGGTGRSGCERTLGNASVGGSGLELEDLGGDRGGAGRSGCELTLGNASVGRSGVELEDLGGDRGGTGRVGCEVTLGDVSVEGDEPEVDEFDDEELHDDY